jgi:tetratricopeptide (TPR) repeat protein
VRSCPKEALSVGFGRPSLWRGAFHDVGGAGGVAGVESKSMRPSLASDLSWPEELLSAAVFLAALFAFWGLYSKVPFLLSIGLSALAAVAAIALKRQLAQRDFQLQWASWRVAGRFTARGIAGTLLAVAFLAFVTQSALVRHHERAGDAAFERFNADSRDAGAAADAAAHLEAALELGLFPDGKTQNLLAIVEQRTGHPERALPHLRRAIEIEPTATRWTALARLLAELGQPDAAREAMQNATRSP